MHENKLAVIDGATLMSTPLPPIRFVVNELLPQGLHILAGAPKVGKSWLALWLCLCIAKGEPVWNFPVEQGAVLYLCLEDSYSRIQTRLLDITDDAPEELFFVTMSEKLHCGLEQQIEAFLNEHPNTALIVIDTLQSVVASSVSLASPQAARLTRYAAPPFQGKPTSLGFALSNADGKSDEYDFRHNRNKRCY